MVSIMINRIIYETTQDEKSDCRIHHGKLSDFIVSDGNSIVFVRILGTGIQSEVIGVGKILD